MRIVLHIWRQRNASEKGRMVRYEVPNVNHEMSFLEMLDVLNEDLIARNEDPVAFDHDCREGICGTCGCMVNGVAHGPLRFQHQRRAHFRLLPSSKVTFVRQATVRPDLPAPGRASAACAEPRALRPTRRLCG